MIATNAFKQAVVGTYTTSDTVIELDSISDTVGNADYLPNGGFNLILYDGLFGNPADANNAGSYEILECTSVNYATNEITVVRAQENTAAVTIGAGSWQVVYGATKELLESLTPDWGQIGGTLSDQTDLQTALDGKVDTSAIVNDLTTGGVAVPLSAEQGKVLDGKFPIPIDYLVIGGGGGGGRRAGNGGGGGGAGEYREDWIDIVLGREYDVEIGAGGAGTSTAGNKGSQSRFADILCIGGGGGGGQGRPITAGNGGGGGQGELGGVGISGNDGGLGGPNSGNFRGGGGGGASASGQNGDDGGNGGAGKSSSITGTAVTRAGGGGAGSFDGTPSSGGSGGGGAGSTTTGGNGTANTGSGGGGGASTIGGDGGSGVVILRYPDTLVVTLGAGLTGSTDTDGAFKVTTITAGADTVEFNLA